jgi:hypothetical protein
MLKLGRKVTSRLKGKTSSLILKANPNLTFAYLLVHPLDSLVDTRRVRWIMSDEQEVPTTFGARILASSTPREKY